MKWTSSTMKIILDIEQITSDDVVSVYVGKAGKCCCGCAGKHTYNSAKRAEGSESRGYEVTDDEVDDKEVARVLKIVKDNARKVEKSNDGTLLSVSLLGREYLLYAAKGVKFPMEWNDYFDGRTYEEGLAYGRGFCTLPHVSREYALYVSDYDGYTAGYRNGFREAISEKFGS